MFHYFLAFLLINTCYQSLGIPIDSANNSLSKSLTLLSTQCENAFLSDQIKNKIKDCNVDVVPPYKPKQLQCFIFYDISSQLCKAVASSKLALNGDYLPKINENHDVNSVCMQAKEWVFTNMTDFVAYKDAAEKFIKQPATCGEVCGVEDTFETNYYCKYYKWGLEMLKSQLPTVANNANNNAVAAPVISEPDGSDKADIPVNINSNPLIPQEGTKTMNGQIKQTEPDVAKTTPHKAVEVNEEVGKADVIVQATSKQTPKIEVPENIEKVEEANDIASRLEDPSVVLPDNVAPSNDQGNKSTGVNAEKPAVVNDVPESVPESGKDLPVNPEQKDAVLENPKQKADADAEDYDSEGNDNVGEDDSDDPVMDAKVPEQPESQNTYVRPKQVIPAHDVDVSQKEYYPITMSDDFSEDNDHFFPFFMTAIVLMVLLYVLYHNKSKVSKVFFGLILEGRQNNRRRNSRGHAYRRLDTLEQAMSANTAAPPSKIIY